MIEVLAVIGAVTGVLGLLMSLRKEWLDRPRLRIQIDPTGSTAGTGTLVAIVENHGRQPASVARLAVTWDVEERDVAGRPSGEQLFNSPHDRITIPAGGSLVREWQVPAKPRIHLDTPLRPFAAYGNQKVLFGAPIVY